jgi:hypothetical protein
MATYRGTHEEMARMFAAQETKRAQRVVEAVHESCLLGAEVVAKAAPVDQGLIKMSTRAQRLGPTRSRIISDAPHSGIVELGSRPHMPPLGPILKWVRRHRAYFTQGAVRVPRRAKPGAAKPKRKFKLSTRVKRFVRGLIRGALKRFGIGPKKSRATRRTTANTERRQSTEKELLAIAQGIRFKIAKTGTKPTHFTRKQLPKLQKILRVIVARRIEDR